MFTKILFCADFSEDSDHAFSYAFNLATACNATLLKGHRHRGVPLSASKWLPGQNSVGKLKINRLLRSKRPVSLVRKLW